jgi:hypothetical protein
LYTLRTKNVCKEYFLQVVVCLLSDLKPEPLNKNANEQQIMKNKRNTCFPSTSSLTNAAQIIW